MKGYLHTFFISILYNRCTLTGEVKEVNKVSIKLGLLFLVFILVIEAGLFFYLYTGLANTRISEELESLRVRGNSHREVLEQHRDPVTLSHVALMESETDTDVVITNINGKVLSSSTPLITGAKEAVNEWRDKQLPYEGEILQRDWKQNPYIATASPIEVNERQVGTVYMFKDTKDIKGMIDRLQHHFYIAGVISILFAIVTTFALSKLITAPLVKMKHATEKISQGHLMVKLGAHSRDEVGQLGTSIQALANELQRLKKERNEFLSSISHELQTPLMYVKGYADMAKRHETSEENRTKYLRIIEEEAARISKLVKDLFQLARLDKNTFLIEKQKVELHFYLVKICEAFQLALSEKNVHIELNCPKHVNVLIDEERFMQVITNVLDNALKYSETKKILMSVEEGNSHVKLSIQDYGVGIPSEDVPYVFDKLYRVDKSRSRKNGGYGLGLSIVKDIVEAHGGKVEMTSIVEKGTTVRISLPKER